MPQIPSRVCSVPSLARCQFSVANFLTGNNLFSLSFKCTLDGRDRRDFYVIDVRICVCSLVCVFFLPDDESVQLLAVASKFCEGHHQ